MKTQKITACAFVHQNGRLFIAKRAATKKFLPGKFELPGGHIKFGEDIIAGLKREFQEEFNVEIIVDEAFYAFTYINSNEHVVEIEYLARLADPNTNIRLNPDDHSEYRWVNMQEVDELWDKTDAEYPAIVRGFKMISEQ